jgi:hypothetical protein
MEFAAFAVLVWGEGDRPDRMVPHAVTTHVSACGRKGWPLGPAGRSDTARQGKKGRGRQWAGQCGEREWAEGAGLGPTAGKASFFFFSIFFLFPFYFKSSNLHLLSNHTQVKCTNKNPT